jgi:hypothetical protein
MRMTPEYLYNEDDADDLIRAIRLQLEKQTRLDVPIKDWAQLLAELEPNLESSVRAHKLLPARR